MQPDTNATTDAPKPAKTPRTKVSVSAGPVKPNRAAKRASVKAAAKAATKAKALAVKKASRAKVKAAKATRTPRAKKAAE